MLSASPTPPSRSNLNVIVPEWSSNSNNPVSPPVTNPQTLHRSKTATRPLRSSPLAGPAVLSLNDPPINPNSTPNLLSPPLSVHLRPKSKSAQTLARPVSLYSYSYSYSPGNPTSSGYNKRPSTAPGPSTDAPATNKRFSLGSFPASTRSLLDVRNAPPVPQRPSFAVISRAEVQDTASAVHPQIGPRARIPERINASSGNHNVNDQAVPGTFLLPPPPSASGGASARVRYSYASSSAGPSSRPVSFALTADSDDAEAGRAWRTSYRPSPSPSPTPRPILKHPSSRASFARPSTPPSTSPSTSPSSPTSNSSSSSDGSSATKPVTTRLSGSFNTPDGSWYTFSPYATTPKFSRLGLSASGVVMPVSAKEMARRNGGVSRTPSVRTGHGAKAARAGQADGRRTSMASSANASSSVTSSVNSEDAPVEKKQMSTPEWLSIPPPARGGHRGHTRRRSRGSLRSLQKALQTQTQTQTQPQSTASSSSPTRSSTSTSSATSSSSSLRSSRTSTSLRGGDSSTSTPASTPPSSTPSSLSKKSWRSVRASLSSAAGYGPPQMSSNELPPFDLGSASGAGSRSTSTSVTAMSSVLGSKETAKPSAFGLHRDECMDNTQDGQLHDQPTSIDNGVECATMDDPGAGTPLLKKRKSASALLARVKSWRRTGKGPDSRDLEKEMDVDFERKEERERKERQDEKSVVGVAEVKAEMQVAIEDLELRQAQRSNETGEEKAAKVEVDGDSPPDSKERHCDDQSQKDEHVNEMPTTTSQPDPCPESLTSAATLIVVPIPSPNLHVAASVPNFVRQVAEIDMVKPGELNSITNLAAHQYTQEHSKIEPNASNGVLVVDAPDPTLLTSRQTGNHDTEDLAFEQPQPQSQAERPTHRQKRSSSVRRLWNAIVCAGGGTARATKSTAEPIPAVPDIGKEWGRLA